MKERPILFSAPMVRAILTGTKTQTRRVVKPQPPVNHSSLLVDAIYPVVIDRNGDDQPGAERYGVTTVDGEWCLPCPYGQPGDRLYVRENGWQRPERTAKMMRDGADTWEPYYFDADGLTEQDVADFKAWGFKRRPSIHMPRAHSRILLEIVSVRVERLQEISEADALAEGAEPFRLPVHPAREALRHVDGFHYLWNSINGPGSWDTNPYVWVVEFKRA